MYVTAGLGPAAANEGFTVDYDLPNDTAYAETCASVALIFWAQRMLNLELDGAYADVMELALYNGALSGLGRDGTHVFLSEPAGERRQPHALGLAPLPLLHHERLAPRRLDRRLFLFDRRRTCSPCISMAATPPSSSVGGTPVAYPPGDGLSLVGQGGDHGRPGDADDLCAEAPHPGLGAEGDDRA